MDPGRAKRGSPFAFGRKHSMCQRASSTARFQWSGSCPERTNASRCDASDDPRCPLIAMMPSAHCARVDLSILGL